MNIIQWPDERLSQVCAPVEHGERCRELVDGMLATLEASGNGIGLAAPQVGVMKRVIVVRVPHKHFGGTQIVKHVIINPQIFAHQGEMVEGWEGCLSFPDHQVSVPRWPRIQVVGYDLRWEPIKIGAKGLVARAIQHEIDHLNGITIAHYARIAYEKTLADAQEVEQQLGLFQSEGGPGFCSGANTDEVMNGQVHHEREVSDRELESVVSGDRHSESLPRGADEEVPGDGAARPE